MSPGEGANIKLPHPICPVPDGHVPSGVIPVSLATETQAPAGWYHDPLGLPQVRWWNGMMWTNDVQAPRPEIQVSAAYRTELVTAP